MKVAILQSNYVPWKGYFEMINNVDVFCFYDEVKYTKNDWRNRNKIVGPNGLYWITIPVSKDSVKLKISEVSFRNLEWVDKHLLSLKQSYSKSPFKTEVLDFLEPFYIDANDLSLSQFNQQLIREICKFVGIKTSIVDSSHYELINGRVDRLVDLLNQLNATNYISGPAAKSYLADQEQLFAKSGITISYMNYGPYQNYIQPKNQFEEPVSIIDLLMNVPRKEVLDYITSIR